MTFHERLLSVLAGFGALFSISVMGVCQEAQTDEVETQEATEEVVHLTPIQSALADLPEDVRLYNDHITTLANPFFEGRLPGTDGMEYATKYMEYYFKRAGLVPAFDLVETDSEGNETVNPNADWRQGFALGSKTEISGAIFSAVQVSEEIESHVLELDFVKDEDFGTTGYGATGDVSGPIVFVGYAIDNGPDGFTNFPEETDLTGKIALMMRFEPMDEEGNSLWSSSGPWTGKGGFRNKFRALKERGAAGVIIVNTPGANDLRAGDVNSASSGRKLINAPVFLISTKAAEQLVSMADPEGRSLLDLRHLADEGGEPIELSNVDISMEITVEKIKEMAYNVGGVLPGRGDLADEYIIIGAHLDHLGMGYFGSRSGPGKLHPGADDNASGSAGVLLLADQLSKSYAELPDDANLRSILLMGFSAEESGLNGARHYVKNPTVPHDKISLMINFDMIGRIIDGRLSVSGIDTAEGLKDWLQPFFDASPLNIVPSGKLSGGSDHLPFFQAKIPSMFSIIADFHADYHTPNDVSWKINRVGAVQTTHLYHDIVIAASQRPDKWVFKKPGKKKKPAEVKEEEKEVKAEEKAEDKEPSRRQISVRFGIIPQTYSDEEPGVAVSGVTEGAPAEKAGIRKGDRLMTWDGQEITGIGEWMAMLMQHKPGDVVDVGVDRDDERVIIKVTLEGREKEDK